MARSIQKKIKFSKGQVSPQLIERTDLELYNSSAQKMDNFVSTIYGGVNSRRGMSYIDDVYTSQLTGTVTESMGGTSSYIQTPDNEYVSNNIGTSRTICTIDYGSVKSQAYVALKDIRLSQKGTVWSNSSFTVTNAREYQIDMCGGGGGGSNNFGGRGAAISCYVNLPTGTYTYTKGAGGAGASAYVRNNNGSDGGLSQLVGNDLNIVCGGGTGRAGRRNGGGGGKCGVLNYIIPYTNTIIGRTTDNQEIGVSYFNNSYGTAGAGGQAQSNDEGAGYAGQAGGLTVYVGYVRVNLETSSDGSTWNTIHQMNVTTDKLSWGGYLTNVRYLRLRIVENDNIKNCQIKLRQLISYQKSNNTIVLKKFIFNDSEKYLLAFSNETLNIYKDDTLVQFLETSGLTESRLRSMKLTYKDDTIIITHPDIYPKELKRTSSGWTYGDFTLKNIPYFAFGGETTTTFTVGITPSGTDGSVKITCDSDIFASNWVGQYIDGNGGRVKITQYVSGTVLNGYTVIPFYTTDKISTWDKISGYEEVWSSTRGYPRTCLFAQQRLWFGGSRDLPTHVWASRLGDYNNFKNSGNYDNDSIDITLLTNNPILNMIENRGLQIFTAGEEYSSNEEYTPDKIAITPNTHNGSFANIQPALIAGTTCYVEKNGKSILSYVYNYEQASYVSNNLSLYTDLLQKPLAMDVEVNSSTDKGDFIYTVLEDGTALVACVVLDQNIMSMSTITTNGTIKDVCCVLEDTYFVVERDGYSYIEKLTDRKTDLTKKVYINSQEVTGLALYNGHNVYVYNDTYAKEYFVISGVIDLDKTLEGNYYIGLPFSYELESMPIDINGKTTTIKKRIAKAIILTTDTPRLEFNNQTKRNNTKYEFYACTSYKDDVRFKITGEFYPINILSVTLNLNYEG